VKLCDSFSDSSVILIGAKDEEELGSYIEKNTKASVLNLIGKTSLLQSAAIMSKSNLFIGHASGPTQLAAAMGVPIVAIYASDDKRNFGPLSKNAIVVTPHTRCAPCSHFYQWLFWGLRLRYINRCKAMDTIEVRDVRVACQKMLNA
jgi:ADP-heptose:LPS heptosyltransferase